MPKHGLKIVGSKGTESSSAPGKRVLTRIERDGFIADIYSSRALLGEIYHYVVQRKGSPTILYGGQEVSLLRAIDGIEQFLKYQNRLRLAAG